MSEPLKVGMVGTGSISNSHMAAYLEHPDRVRLVAVCDVIEEAARDYAKRAGVEAVYTDLADMLGDSDIDAVDICTGHDQHAAPAIAAARAGKHVLVEKAMAHTLQDCRDMIDAAEAAGVTLMVAQHLRHGPAARAVKRFIDEGNLGEIRAIQTHAIISIVGAKPGGHWMTDGKQGGGVMLTNTVHHIDLLRYYIGNVKRVTGVCKSVQPQMINGADDMVAATLEFDNGAIGTVFGNWTTSPSHEPMSYVLYGSNGTLHTTVPQTPEQGREQFGTIMFCLRSPEEVQARPRAQPSGPSTRERFRARTRPSFEPLEPDYTDLPTPIPMVNEILHFEECCRTGKEPISSGRDNIETMKIILGIFESSRTGKAIDLDDL